jgi:hypothetical protein
MKFHRGGEKNVKRQTVILATFLIAVFTTATIFAEVAAAQHPTALIAKSMASTQHNDPNHKLHGYLSTLPFIFPPPYNETPVYPTTITDTNTNV